jgi:hypothetical protein
MFVFSETSSTGNHKMSIVLILRSGVSPIEHTAKVEVKGTKISIGVGVGVHTGR